MEPVLWAVVTILAVACVFLFIEMRVARESARWWEEMYDRLSIWQRGDGGEARTGGATITDILNDSNLTKAEPPPPAAAVPSEPKASRPKRIERYPL